MLLEGRFALGVGTGEALNEHILGGHWPEAEVRLEMLEERIGDGYMTTTPDGELIERFRGGGGADKPIQAGTKVCYGADADESLRTAHRLWPNDRLPGELAQILPTPEHFEQASGMVTETMVKEVVPHGPDLEAHLASFQQYADAGVDELFVQQIGGDRDEFFEVYAREIVPRFN